MDPVFFPEPIDPDVRPGLRRETTWEFLHRSTWSRAAEIRAFYNNALAALPPESRKPILGALAAGRTESALFEIAVGRFLQLRGGLSLEHEPESGGRHVDWRATFPDGVLHVEAMVPVYNAESVEKASRHDRLLDLLEERVPDGWFLLPFHLPVLSGHAPLYPFSKLAQELLAQIPAADSVQPGAMVQLRGRLPEGRVEFTALRAKGSGGLGGGAMITHFDNSEKVIREAWANRRKRKQGRSVSPPALLAIAGSFLGADLEDFEMALFGRDVRIGRKPDGAMAVDRNPPWAGVLAFPTVSPASVADPVLFVAPAYTGPLPASVDRLEVRRLELTGFVSQDARDTDVMVGMRWAAH